MAKLREDSSSFEVYIDLTPEERKELAEHIVYKRVELSTVPIELRSSGNAAYNADERVLARLEQNNIARGASHNIARNSNVCR